MEEPNYSLYQTEYWDTMTFNEYVQMEKNINIIVNIANKMETEKDKVDLVYYMLGKAIYRDMKRAGAPRGSADSKNCRKLSSVFLEGKTVCLGYNKAFKEVMDRLEIPCKSISAEEDLNGIGHNYNQVRIDGIWYNLDLTWDAEFIKGDKSLENYLLSDAEFSYNEIVFYHIPSMEDILNESEYPEKCLISHPESNK